MQNHCLEQQEVVGCWLKPSLVVHLDQLESLPVKKNSCLFFETSFREI
jgi:hypothetical protein